MKAVRHTKCLIYGLLYTLASFGSQALAMAPEGLRTDIDKHERDIHDLANFAREVLGDENQDPIRSSWKHSITAKSQLMHKLKQPWQISKLRTLGNTKQIYMPSDAKGFSRRLKELRFRNTD